MRVKSFPQDMEDGFDNALVTLDNRVNKTLGSDVVIHSVTDTFYFAEQDRVDPVFSPRMVRVVVYSSPSVK